MRYPLHVLWQLTERCELRCTHCHASAGEARSDELTLEEILEVLGQLRRASVVDLGFSGGEPLLRPDVFDVLAAATAAGFRVGVGSSGWGLDEATLREVERCGVHRLQISLDGLERSHDAIRRPGSFARAVAALRLASRLGLRVHVCYTPQRRNHAELEEVAHLAHALGARLFNVSQYVPVGRGAQADDLAPGQWEALAARYARLRAAYAGRMELRCHLSQAVLSSPAPAPAGFAGCAAGRGQGCITARGVVTPCVLLPVPVGDLRRGPFAELWDGSPVIRALRERRGLGGRCGTCRWTARCGGCRGVAHAATGDLLGEDVHCWLR